MAQSAIQFDAQLYIELRKQFPGVPEQLVSTVIRTNKNDRDRCLAILNREQLRYGPYAVNNKPSLTVDINPSSNGTQLQGSFSDSHFNQGFNMTQNINNHPQYLHLNQQMNPQIFAALRPSSSFPNLNLPQRFNQGQASPNFQNGFSIRPSFEGINGNYVDPNSQMRFMPGHSQRYMFPPRLQMPHSSQPITSPPNSTVTLGLMSGGSVTTLNTQLSSENGAQTPGSDSGAPQSNHLYSPPSQPESLMNTVIKPIQTQNHCNFGCNNGVLHEHVSGTGHLLAEEIAYKQAYLLHQKRSYEKFRSEYQSLSSDVEELRKMIDIMENKSLNRQKSTEMVISRENLKEIQDENRRINVETQITLQEIANLKNGQVPYGQINANAHGPFHDSLGTGPQLPTRPQENETTVPFQPPRPPTPSDVNEGANWNCGACTFENHYALEKCEICEFPKIKPGGNMKNGSESTFTQH